MVTDNRRFEILFGAVLTALLSSTAKAFVGTHVVQGAMDSTCRIVRLSPQGDVLGACTATLTGPTEVTTAAHCVKRFPETPQSLLIQCGYKQFDPTQAVVRKTAGGNLIFLEGPEFLENGVLESIEMDEDYHSGRMSGDFAVIRLASPLKTEPTPLISHLELNEIFDTNQPLKNNPKAFSLKTGATCVANGFAPSLDSHSIEAYKNEIIGRIPHLAKFQTGDLYWDIEQGTLFSQEIYYLSERESYIAREKHKNASVFALWLASPERGLFNGPGFPMEAIKTLPKVISAPGDSGGGYFCRPNDSTPWKLAGVLCSIDNGVGILPVEGPYPDNVKNSLVAAQASVDTERTRKMKKIYPTENDHTPTNL